MFAWVRMAVAMGLLAGATALYGCGGSGGSGSGLPADATPAPDPMPTPDPMPDPDPMPAPDELSSLSAPYDTTPAGVDEMLPEGSTHLIEDIAAALMRAGGTPLEQPRGWYANGGNRIVSSGNTVIAGPRVGNWDRRLPEFTCVGTVCDSNPPETPFQVVLDQLVTEPKVVQKVLAKNGINVLQFSFGDDWEIEYYYGHYELNGLTLMSDVAVGETYYETGDSIEKATNSGGPYATYDHVVGGFVAGTNPTGNATYRGIMAGSVVEKDQAVDLNAPEWVIGDADLSFDLAMLELDATFSNIVALESGDTFADLEWTGISVNNGAFKQVVVAGDNYIEGAFFGANQEGAAGVFEQDSISGSFSAMDPTADVEPGLTDVEMYTLSNLSQARNAAGGATPDFTVAEYDAAITDLFGRSDVLLAGNRIASWSTRTLPFFDCEGTVCEYDDGEGDMFTLDSSTYEVAGEAHEAVMTKNGVGVAQFALGFEWGEGVNSGYNFQYGLGLWGEENVAWTNFFFQHSSGRYSYYENFVSGVTSGSNPSGSATYTGVMAGSVVEKDPAEPLNTPDWVMGDAQLAFDLGDATLDATFDNIVSLASGASHDDLSWEDVPVIDGGFETGSDDDHLVGEFFGANHEGVAGVFEQDSIAGVFSASQ